MLWPACALAIWLVLLSLPFQPWRVRERFDAKPPCARQPGQAGRADDTNLREIAANDTDLGDVCVLIPARDEAAHIGNVLAALKGQGRNLAVIVVDDRSSDQTAAIARGVPDVRLVAGQALPSGWAGKLWALEQGRGQAARAQAGSKIGATYTLLLDADIELQPGLIAALRDQMRRERLQLVSLMPALRMTGFWEKLLLPAFVYFFKLLYPFRLSNDARFRRIAAAAGGCILLETRVIEAIGGFAALKDALIDDCALARRAKAAGFATWIGLTHSVRSVRAYDRLRDIWDMVARSAYTQLHYSMSMLAALTLVFAIAFWLPIIALAYPAFAGMSAILAASALLAMAVSYLPVLRFYRLSPAWALALPVIASLFLAMTWSSALRYHRGERARWKGRIYGREPAYHRRGQGPAEVLQTHPEELQR